MNDHNDDNSNRVLNTSVLNLGERIVLAARLAAIEHVRQEIQRQATIDAVISDDVELAAEAEAMCDRWRGFFAVPKKGAA